MVYGRMYRKLDQGIQPAVFWYSWGEFIINSIKSWAWLRVSRASISRIYEEIQRSFTSRAYDLGYVYLSNVGRVSKLSAPWSQSDDKKICISVWRMTYWFEAVKRFQGGCSLQTCRECSFTPICIQWYSVPWSQEEWDFDNDLVQVYVELAVQR